jgi:hypothetical protein
MRFPAGAASPSPLGAKMFEERSFSSGLLELPPNSVKQKEMANNTEAQTPLPFQPPFTRDCVSDFGLLMLIDALLPCAYLSWYRAVVLRYKFRSQLPAPKDP